MKNPTMEAYKEVARWAVFYIVSMIVSWFLMETLAQITKVPEVYELHLGWFVYSIPVRGLVTTALTLLARGVDKYLHEIQKQLGKYYGDEPRIKGLLWF